MSARPKQRAKGGVEEDGAKGEADRELVGEEFREWIAKRMRRRAKGRGLATAGSSSGTTTLDQPPPPTRPDTRFTHLAGKYRDHGKKEEEGKEEEDGGAHHENHEVLDALGGGKSKDAGLLHRRAEANATP